MNRVISVLCILVGMAASFAAEKTPFSRMELIQHLDQSGGKLKRSSKVGSFSEGKVVTSRSAKFAHRKDLVAIPKKDVLLNQKVFKYQGPWALVSADDTSLASTGVQAQHVVFNGYSKKYAVATRKILVKIQDIGELERIAKDYNLNLVESNQEILLGIFESYDELEFDEQERLIKELRADARILRVRREVLERFHEQQ